MTDPRALPTADELLRHVGWLRRLAERLVGEDAADDLLQETWLSALRHRPRSLGPWLRRVLHNRAAGDARARSRLRAREIAHAQPEALPSTGDLAARAEATRLLVEAVLRLNPVQRDVILLRYFDELSPAVIAARLAMPSATVRSHLARGLARLRKNLDAASGGDRAHWAHALAPLTTTTVPTTAHPSPLLTAIHMTTAYKVSAGLFLVLLGLGIVSLQQGIEPHETPMRLEGQALQPRAVAVEESSGKRSQDLQGWSHEAERVRRSAIFSSSDTPRPGTMKIQVVHAKTGMALPGATVLYSAPGFEWGQLESEAQEEYSLSTERFLRASGESQVADDSGVVEIPIAAAYKAVVGRKGDLYGRVEERAEEEVWKLALSPYNTLAVEVFDTRGLPVAGVRIIGENRPSFSNPFAMRSLLGTTDENGLVTHLFKVPDPQGMPQKLSVFVSLPAGDYGAFEWNPAAPPRQPVRITLPPTGSVTVHILDPSGNHLDPSILGDPNVEIVVLDPAAPPPRTALPFASQTRQRARIEADGFARFRNVILGRTMSISAPALLGAPIEFSGPREGKVDVLVEHRMQRDHPAVVGRLVDADHRPIRNTHFSILCRSGDELLSLVGGVTDDRGWFLAYLAERAMGMRPGEITFGMAWKGMSQSRAVRVPVRGQLTGRVQVGDVMLPEAE